MLILFCYLFINLSFCLLSVCLFSFLFVFWEFNSNILSATIWSRNNTFRKNVTLKFKNLLVSYNLLRKKIRNLSFVLIWFNLFLLLLNNIIIIVINVIIINSIIIIIISMNIIIIIITIIFIIIISIVINIIIVSRQDPISFSRSFFKARGTRLEIL